MVAGGLTRSGGNFLVSWVWRRSRAPTSSEHRRAWNEEDICCLCRGRNDCRFARRNARKRTAWRRPRRRGSGPLLARPLRSGSRAIRRFWQLRMGDAAFLERQWLAGPPSASLRLIRDDGEIERLIATIDVEGRPALICRSLRWLRNSNATRYTEP